MSGSACSVSVTDTTVDHMDNTFSERTARNVASAMKATGVSEHALAERTGIARVTLRRRLDGHHGFSLNEAEAIAKALDVPIAQLLGAVAA